MHHSMKLIQSLFMVVLKKVIPTTHFLTLEEN
jgi:hypothetical protein